MRLSGAIFIMFVLHQPLMAAEVSPASAPPAKEQSIYLSSPAKPKAKPQVLRREHQADPANFKRQPAFSKTKEAAPKEESAPSAEPAEASKTDSNASEPSPN